MRILFFLLTAAIAPSLVSAQTAGAPGPYRVLKVEKVGGAGGFDYVYADAAGRRLYIARSNRMTVFDLDSLKAVGEIPDTKSAHGAVVDASSHHGFVSQPRRDVRHPDARDDQDHRGRRQSGRNIFR